MTENQQKLIQLISELPDDCEITVQFNSVAYLPSINATVTGSREICVDIVHIDLADLRAITKPLS